MVRVVVAEEKLKPILIGSLPQGMVGVGLLVGKVSLCEVLQSHIHVLLLVQSTESKDVVALAVPTPSLKEFGVIAGEVIIRL